MCDNSITMTDGPFEEAVYIAGMPNFPHTSYTTYRKWRSWIFRMMDGDGLRLVMSEWITDSMKVGEMVKKPTVLPVLGKMEFMAADIYLGVVN